MSTPTMVMQVFWVTLVVILGAVLVIMPRLTRPDLWFSVTVDANFRDTDLGRRILRTYQWVVAAVSALALLVVAVGIAAGSPLTSTVSLLVQLAGYAAAFLLARHRTLPHAAAPSLVREAELRPRRAALPGGWVLQAGPFAVLLAVGVWLSTQWHRLPARFPSHWDLSGEPDAWATRTPGAVFSNLAVGAVLCALLLVFALAILRRSRRVRSAGAPGEAEQHFRLASLSVLLAAEYVVAVTFAALSLLPLLRHPGGLLALVAVLSLALVVAAVVVLGRAGQGGSRLAPPDAAGKPVGDRTADRHWTWGIFYVNRQDPALFVEKRFGLGYTVNLGNPWSWVLLALLIVLPLAITIALRLASA